jgi:hypothetical protein
MEEARIKMVGEPSWAKENVVSGIARLVRESGLLASFGGLSAMLSKQVFILTLNIFYLKFFSSNWLTMIRFHTLWVNKCLSISSQRSCTL